VFELMLQEVQGVTPSAAAGIRAEYTSFKVLMDAYERAEKKGRERAEMLLQDCEVGLVLLKE
jgi:crossover junction endonuclease EME1